jgi:hypothetical protein
MSQTPPPPTNYYSPPPQGAGPNDAQLTGLDWVLIVLCSGIGCIVGIVYLVQGKPKGGKMLGYSLVFVVIWNIVSFVIRRGMH